MKLPADPPDDYPFNKTPPPSICENTSAMGKCKRETTAADGTPANHFKDGTPTAKAVK